MNSRTVYVLGWLLLLAGLASLVLPVRAIALAEADNLLLRLLCVLAFLVMLGGAFIVAGKPPDGVP
jgi:hypothetical protein